MAIWLQVAAGKRLERNRADVRRNGLRRACKLFDSDVCEKGCRLQPFLDGHNRREICEELGLPFEISQKSLPDRSAAIDWIVMHQLGRRNLPEEQKAHLRGLRYRNEKKKVGGNGANQHSEQCAQSGHIATRTAEKLAEELGVSATTIRRDADFSEAVDAIGKNVGKEA